MKYLTYLITLLSILCFVARLDAKEVPDSVGKLVENTCVQCHDSLTAEGGLNLEDLSFDLSEQEVFQTWVKVHDRIAAGEMPPADFETIPSQQKAAVVTALAQPLRAANLAKQQQFGRVQYRRLNRVEYEYTLRDLLGLPWLDVKDMLPADNSAHGFDKVGAALDLSYVQLARYLEAANHGLDQAMRLGPRPKTESTYLEALTNGRFSQVAKKGREAVVIDHYVGLLRQPNTAQAPWGWSKFGPAVEGKYRLRMKTFGFYWEKGKVLPAKRTHIVTLQARNGTTIRALKSFDLPRTQAEAAVLDCTVTLVPGDQIQVHIETLDDRGKPGNKKMEEYSAPGVAIEWLKTDGPLLNQWPPRSYRRLFGKLPAEPWTEESGLKEPPLPMIVQGIGKRATLEPAKRNKITLYHVVSQHPSEDAKRLLHQFAERAFRRPVASEELAGIVSLVEAKLDQKFCFQEAMRIGYQAILCSPEFLFLQEQPGRLDDYAVASRLAYFLWSSLPDEELLALAANRELSQPTALRQQVERMLADERSQRFVEDFCGQWLDLREITITQPDDQLYPEFDQLLLSSMVEETQAYFAEMLNRDLGARYLVDSNFAIVNGRLAKHYGIPDVDGVTLRKVSLSEDSVRGGFLTQASILKITANGTTTSPVVRGAWVLEELLGTPVPPPPPNVPAVEPDLRGATTIREQLAKHRDVAACASCHRRIDPPGFALESFDVIGGWRERYRSLGHGDPVNKNPRGHRPIRYKLGPPVDPSGTAPNGQRFADIHGFRKLLLAQEEQLARNLVEKLMIYATGAGIDFADREAVESILQETKAKQYGLRSLIHAIVQSETFLRK